MTATEKGRRRQQALYDFLGQYSAATTNQLARLIWNGDERLARAHLLGYLRQGLLRRVPHPLYRNGPFVYTRTDRSTSHSQKILHHLAEVEFYLAVVRSLARYGARVVAEMPWAPGLIPDQTVIVRDRVWAIEHHLGGAFIHASDYRRFMEEEAYAQCHWWHEGVSIGLLVITLGAGTFEHVQGQLSRHNPVGLRWRVTTRETALKDPGGVLGMGEGWR